MSNKTNWFGLIGTKTIAELDLIGTESIVFLWYNVSKRTNQWWKGDRNSADPIKNGSVCGGIGPGRDIGQQYGRTVGLIDYCGLVTRGHTKKTKMSAYSRPPRSR